MESFGIRVFFNPMMPPNEITALDAGMTLLPHAGRRWPGTSEFLR